MKRLILCLMLAFNALQAQTIAEKKAGLGYVGSDLSPEMQDFLEQVNRELDENEKELHHLYRQVRVLHQGNAPPEAFQELLEKINALKANMYRLEEKWREMAMHSQLEGYALWHQPNTTLEQLVIDYGAQDYVYLISPEIAAIPLSINSNLPIPRASWDEMLDLILSQNGVGIKQLNPYLRELYSIHQDRSGLKLITSQRQDLDFLPGSDRIAFFLTPEPTDVRRVWSFLERFTNHNSTVLQMLGRDILIAGRAADVKELLKLYDFAMAHRGDKDYKVVPLSRVDAEEMTRILDAIFCHLSEEPDMGTDGGRGSAPSCVDNGLKVIPLGQIAPAIFLVGTRDEIRKAESLIREVEGQVGEASEKTIYWYGTKHSDAEELAQVLEKIYSLLVATQGMGNDAEGCCAPSNKQQIENIIQQPVEPSYDNGFAFGDDYVVNKMPPREAPAINQDRSNFLVDPKTGSIVMVVEAALLPKLKEVIKKLDVPKKMVQIEILLFEKKIKQQNNFGLNLLRFGSEAKDRASSAGAAFNNITKNHPGRAGIFEFLLSTTKHSGIPAYDLIYTFLLSQDDVQINASPSVLAINQTPATIEIAEEISVNTGVYEVGANAGGSVALRDSFARAQYGIKIGITPTIHMSAENMDGCMDDCPNYVTLSTDITFQTFSPGAHNPNRPDVTTRHIVNEVRIPDGQTVILGGLRQKTRQDRTESIPFLGEIPGIGKFFSINDMRDEGTEMFIFLTPKIILDPCEQLELYKLQQMTLRPGDIPEFLCALLQSWEWEKRHTLQGTMRILFGRTPPRCISNGVEYDGR